MACQNIYASTNSQLCLSNSQVLGVYLVSHDPLAKSIFKRQSLHYSETEHTNPAR